MTRRKSHEIEALPHYVYIHTDPDEAVLYVGRTADPESRPSDTKRRPWIKTESARVIVSPPMGFRAACWVEAEMIRLMSPRHNKNGGQREFVTDWRVDRVVQVEGVSRSTAKQFIDYYPDDPDDFEAFLAARAESLAKGRGGPAEAGRPLNT